ncbi:MAG: CXXX repeat peptide maturase [Muribaculaceae bacterium]|nr:CXXX repeat peptide maturase [Muribaculaceae bacterium]
MLQYMIILLDDTSTSFCHYDVNTAKKRLINLDDLRAGIRMAMIENLTIQFVYPDYDLPQEYRDVIRTIDHSDIKPLTNATQETDVMTLDGWSWHVETQYLESRIVVIRTSLHDLLAHGDEVAVLLSKAQRLNVVITDVERFSDDQQVIYNEWLGKMGQEVERLYVNGTLPQFNLLTDRMILMTMNNCGAGNSCITLAPNGKFYICPAFYYENHEDSVGDLVNGIIIPNNQLYKLDNAPICRNCDSWQCKRCVWLNRKMTLEVNTPSHEQCVMAHLERNASRDLLLNIRKHGAFLPETPDIPKIDYLDPFDNINN